MRIFSKASFIALLSLLFMPPAAARDLAEVRQTGELRICLAGSSAPFYQSNAEAFARTLGVKPVIRTLEKWDQQFQNAGSETIKEASYEAHLLASGQCDLYPNDLHMTDWRRTKMRLVPYYTTRKVIIAHRSLRQELQLLEDLAGRRAAVQKGTAYETWLLQENETRFKSNPVQIEQLPTAESMKRVSNGLADFSVIGAEGAFKWVRGELDNLDLLFPVDELVEVGWGISFGAINLQQALEAFFVENLRVGSAMDRAWQKQYGISRMEYQLIEASFGQQKFGFEKIRVWVIPLGSALTGILLAMLFWTRRLRREIRMHERTEAALRESQEIVARESVRRLALAEMSLHLQQATSEQQFARLLLTHLACHLPIAQAIFCRWDEPTQRLRALAHYAGSGTTPAESLAQILTAGSLIDRCLRECAPILVEGAAAAGLRIRSGLGHGVPTAVMLFPIRQLGRIVAILEIATVKPFDVEHRQLLDDLEPLIALSLERLPTESC